jgi:hypothetical protein
MSETGLIVLFFTWGAIILMHNLAALGKQLEVVFDLIEIIAPAQHMVDEVNETLAAHKKEASRNQISSD